MSSGKIKTKLHTFNTTAGQAQVNIPVARGKNSTKPNSNKERIKILDLGYSTPNPHHTFPQSYFQAVKGLTTTDNLKIQLILAKSS